MGGVVRTVRVWGWNFEVDLDTGIKIVWYGSSYLRQSIFKGSYLMISGIVHNGRFINPEWRIGADVSGSNLNTVTYPVTSGITSKDIGRLVRQVFEGLKTSGTTPPGDRFFYVYTIHRPVNQAMVDGARKWLKREELFYMQLGLAVRQARRAQAPPNVQCVVPPMNTDRYFPFAFTQDQAIAAGEILADLCRPRAMNRLLQGDVGCGKTAVAAYAAIVMAFNGGQTAILCPTEILARQHYETVKGYFERAGVKCCLMAGGYVSSRDYTLVDIVVGTTAIIADNVRFKRLGLVIIDEQHRFGVEQRAALRRHSNPHVLVMTATPIPRTIAMTVFGDLDVSTIKSMPPGRRPVETVWVRHNGQADRMRVRMEAELAAGRQVYVVCPRIEALDDEMRAVEEVWGEYRDLFPHAQVNYLHGKMTPAEKQLTVGWWVAHTPTGRILVSTTVVEVGVDNPNATVMVIEGAERFGLAQLHQLRGRVGRGPHQSYCFLLSDTDSTEAKARLRVMERTNDGFEVAEADLRQRGPGDLLSPRQHGLPDLKIADLVEDYDLLVEARKEAREMVAKGPLPASVQAELEKRFGKNLDLGDAA
jgi:ATP-dependent DNA helicase RecG